MNEPLWSNISFLHSAKRHKKGNVVFLLSQVIYLNKPLYISLNNHQSMLQR